MSTAPMGTQPRLGLEVASATTLNEQVRAVMLPGSRWMPPFEVQQEIQRITGEWHSDSSITARMREQRDFGYILNKRRVTGAQGRPYYEYQLIEPVSTHVGAIGL